MESPGKNLLSYLEERDPANPKFWRRLWASHRRTVPPADRPGSKIDEFNLWGDVFVEQTLPWGRFMQSALLHAVALALIWTMSVSLLRQQKILDRAAFDRSSLVTYTPQEYLPPLDTGGIKMPKVQPKADPVYASQPILSVPPEADNRSQTIVVPPDIKLDRDVPLPNIIATATIAQAVPLDAAPAPLNRRLAPEVPGLQVVAPAPDVASAPNRAQAGMKSDVIAPPPDVMQSTKGYVGPINIGPADVVAPAPQLTVAEQHSPAARGRGRLPGSIQAVAPPPSVAAGNTSASGRLIALGIHPVAPTGPVAVPPGNRRGTFSANPQGKPGASGTPALAESKSEGKSAGGKKGSLPSGLHVGAANSAGDPREVASLSSADTASGARSPRAAAPIANDKITDLDRQVFGGKRVYGRTLNMPNLNSSTGSWVIKFAELGGEQKGGELLEPVATEKSDPGYPLELIRANVHGMVTLYAVIHSDGKVGDIRVLNSPDERLDSYAAKALARWKFVPAERAGKPVALEAVVMIPFKVRRSF
jgi:TonB family protein